MEMSFVITLLVVIFVFAFFMRWMDMISKDRQSRMKLLEEAVKAGNLDDQGREELVAAVSGRRPRRHKQPAAPAAPAAPVVPNRATFIERVMMFFGWMAFLIGGALLTYGIAGDCEDFILAGIIVGLSGFGLLTYPFVIRELESRGPRTATR
jgi:hypothetical protein